MGFYQKQAKKKFLVFEDQTHKGVSTNSPLFSRNRSWKWSDRLILIEDQQSNESWNFIAFDVLMNESRSICFPKSFKNCFYLFKVTPLTDKFGLIIEVFNGISHITLVEFNWDSGEFQFIEHFKHTSSFICVIVDRTQPSKFVFAWIDDDQMYKYQCCKFIDGKIEVGETWQSKNEYKNYSNDKLVKINSPYGDKYGATMYNLISKEWQFFKFKSLSLEHVSLCIASFECVGDRLYVGVCFRKTRKYGIAWTNLTSKRWNLLFKTDLNIYEFRFFNGNLIVSTKGKIKVDKKNELVQKFYSIPITRPHFLRYSAWLRVIHVMKKNGETDPYKAAKEFLPLNSDLQAPWFKDEEKNELKNR